MKDLIRYTQLVVALNLAICGISDSIAKGNLWHGVIGATAAAIFVMIMEKR